MKLASIALLAAVTILAGASPVLAAPSWLPSVPVSSSDDDHNAAVAAGRDGGVVVAWYDDTTMRIMAATRPPGGPFGQPVPVSAQGEAARVAPPAIDIDGAGTVYVAWTNTSDQVRAAVRPAGGSFQVLDTIGPSESPTTPDLAVNADGVAVLAWATLDGSSQWRARAAIRPPGGGNFGASQLLDGPSPANAFIGGPDVAVAPDGTALATWTFLDIPNISRASYAIRPPGGAFGGAQDVDSTTMDDRRYEFALVGVADDGEALAVYQRQTAGGTQWVSARRAPGAATFTFNPTPFASEASQDSASLAMGPDGTAVFAYRSGFDIHAALRLPGGALGTPGVLTPADDAGPVVATAVGSDGRVIVAWARNGDLRGAVRLPGGALESSTSLGASPGGFVGFPAVAIDPAGNAVAAWEQEPSSGNESVIRAAGFDATPPELRDVRFPSGGLAGRPLAFSATTFDVWSPVATTWSFGDGGGATGDSVQHAFGGPGVFGAQVTATDAVGNSATSSGQVSVTDGDAPSVAGLRSTNARFAVGRAATPVSSARRRVRRGTTFRYSLSEPARVTIAIQRAVRGLRSRGRCRPATKALTRRILRRSGKRGLRRARCTLYRSAGPALARDGAAGANGTPFSGRIGRRALRPGPHRAMVTAIDAAGNRSAPASTRFTVVKAPKRR